MRSDKFKGSSSEDFSSLLPLLPERNWLPKKTRSTSFTIVVVVTIVIAMAIALRPDILIADEPTTALDVTVQREVLDLLRDLARDMNTALILITHDMGVVAEVADRVLVMDGGSIVADENPQALLHGAGGTIAQDLVAVPRAQADRLAERAR